MLQSQGYDDDIQGHQNYTGRAAAKKGAENLWLKEGKEESKSSAKAHTSSGSAAYRRAQKRAKSTLGKVCHPAPPSRDTARFSRACKAIFGEAARNLGLLTHT